MLALGVPLCSLVDDERVTGGWVGRNVKVQWQRRQQRRHCMLSRAVSYWPAEPAEKHAKIPIFDFAQKKI
jgi:hypothetical protein